MLISYWVQEGVNGKILRSAEVTMKGEDGFKMNRFNSLSREQAEKVVSIVKGVHERARKNRNLTVTYDVHAIGWMVHIFNWESDNAQAET